MLAACMIPFAIISTGTGFPRGVGKSFPPAWIITLSGFESARSAGMYLMFLTLAPGNRRKEIHWMVKYLSNSCSGYSKRMHQFCSDHVGRVNSIIFAWVHHVKVVQENLYGALLEEICDGDSVWVLLNCHLSRRYRVILSFIIIFIKWGPWNNYLKFEYKNKMHWWPESAQYHLVFGKMIFRCRKLGGLPFEQVLKVLPLDALRGPPEVIQQDHLGVLDQPYLSLLGF